MLPMDQYFCSIKAVSNYFPVCHRSLKVKKYEHIYLLSPLFSVPHSMGYINKSLVIGVNNPV